MPVVTRKKWNKNWPEKLALRFRVWHKKVHECMRIINITARKIVTMMNDGNHTWNFSNFPSGTTANWQLTRTFASETVHFPQFSPQVYGQVDLPPKQAKEQTWTADMPQPPRHPKNKSQNKKKFSRTQFITETARYTLNIPPKPSAYASMYPIIPHVWSHFANAILPIRNYE